LAGAPHAAHEGGADRPAACGLTYGCEDVGDVEEEVRQRAVEVDDLEELLRGSTADADSLGKAEKL